MTNQTLTAIPGILVGHAEDAAKSTGCTAVLCPEGFTPGVAVPGFAPGSRETDLMRPESTVDAVHGIALSGGSAFGLAAADGVMRYLHETGRGYVMPHGIVPIVPGAVIYDLDGNASPGVLPDAAMGYTAAKAAADAPVRRGRVGAGCGARCGRLFGAERASPAGLGSALTEREGIKAAALVVVNALGNVHDPETGACLAGARGADGRLLDSRDDVFAALSASAVPQSNTVLAVVAVNIPLDKAGTNRLARMAAAGLARVIRPAHLLFDGDIMFALSAKTGPLSGANPRTETLLGAMAADAVARAAADAVGGGQGKR
ncbi:P1 family peptidase [Desulfovibrio sp. OttesenSCG-928-O18]|nr:P1 family peptidase [Desulfovibrio sp. OttesenSCG-928-O18]